MDKQIVLGTVVSICSQMGLPVESDVKSDKWKADLVVDYGKYKVAFTVDRVSRRVNEYYHAMREERICGCWLRLPSKYGGCWDSDMPVFHVEEADGEIQVLLNGRYKSKANEVLKLQDFLHKIIQGKIRWIKEEKAKFVDLFFYKEKCWKCKSESDVYSIYRVLSENGMLLNDSFSDKDLTFLPSVVRGAFDFMKNHPERGFILGAIKERYSKTVHNSYMSFGCAYCDALFGNFFLNYVDIGDECCEEPTEDEINDKESSLVRIELKESVVLPVCRWSVVSY